MTDKPAVVIETERLVLRPHTRADFDDSAALWADPDVTRFITGRPSTAEEVWQRLLRYAGGWSLMGFGYWAICERENGRFIGEGGFADLRREFNPPFDGAPEIGWALSPSAQGQGYALEATRAMTAWGDDRFDGARTVCLIGPDNAPSLRLAGKLGYTEYARTLYRGEPVILFERRGKSAES
jgi:RimJ/RimL family protein N-acetyltransferase